MYVCDCEMCIHISISVHVWEQSLLIPKPESFLAGGTLTEVYIVQIYLWTGVTYWILAPYQSTTLFSSGSAIYLCSTTTIFGTCVWVTVIHAGAMKFLSSNCMAGNGSSRAHPHKNAFKSATKDANLHCIYSSTVHRYILYHLYHPHHHHHHHLSHQIIRCSTSSPSWGWCVLSSWPFGIFLSFIFSPPSSPPFIANPLPVLPPQAMDQSRSSMLKGLSRMFYDTELLKTAMLCNKHKSRAVVFISLQLSISHWVFSGTLRLSAYPPHRIPMVCAWTLSPWLS